MSIQTLSTLLSAIVTLAIGGSVSLRFPREPTFNRFAQLCFVLAAWYLTSFVSFALEVTWARGLSFLIVAVVPLMAWRFFSRFPRRAADRLAGEEEPPTPTWLGFLTFALVVAIGYAWIGGRSLARTSFTAVALSLTVLLGLGGSMMLLYQRYRATVQRVEKARTAYVFIGGVLAIAANAADLLAELVGPFPTPGNVATLVYMYFVSQTLLRFRLLDLNELLSKMLVVSIFVFVLTLHFTLMLVWVPADRSSVFFFNTAVASFVVLILFEPVRTAIEGFVQKWFFREKREFTQRLDRLRASLMNIIDIREATALLMTSLEASGRVTQAAMYLVDAEGAGYDLVGHVGSKPVERLDAATRRPLVERLVESRAPISIEQLERASLLGEATGEGDREEIDQIARTLDEMNGALCVPLLAGPELVGLLCLRDDRLREAFASDEIELLRGIGAQLATTVQNSKLYERMKDRDRLAALGEMAAGLAHEIRNPLGAIKGAAQLILPSGEAGAETSEFLSIIVEEVNRLNKVVSQFLDYSRPLVVEKLPFDLNEVVRRSAQVVLSSLPEADRDRVELHLGEAQPSALGDGEQIHQVLLNLGLNAMQAMPERGKLRIETALRTGARGGFVEVRFRDEGPGIGPEQLGSLFIPFFTTKPKGTGLGLAISQRIVQIHGGTIEVRSRVGSGSTFTVVLPAAPPR